MSPLARFEHCNWTLVPDHLHDQLERWLADGKPPKSLFLQRVLMNDLVGAVSCAGPLERVMLADLAQFLNEPDCPFESYGSSSHYNQWIKIGGWRGLRDAEVRYEPQ